ncbi:MAG: MBOAT family protein [Lachnospiraceae bacterium]|nr:MBOAT family protein [Lachnospiraceae bacterium]
MLFSSIPFLFYFLPFALVLYAVTPKRLKNAVLVLESVIFYAWGEPKYILLMVTTVFAGYGFGLLMEYRKKKGQGSLAVFVLSVICVLASLGYFKYTGFILESVNKVAKTAINIPKIALPIGISFYSFQLLSYLCDVYRGREEAQHNFIDLAAYIFFFPQLIAGPIVRYSDIVKQLKERRHSISQIEYGIRRFILGLSKKVLVANMLAQFCAAFYQSQEKTVLFIWGYALAYSLQVYFDFSGYSDMAIGLGSIFGFTFPENFLYPFVSESITDFWRRWHVTLGSWFRDYVYIPLGGNRVSIPKYIRNILIVWALTGLWHGASWNFVIWGLYYAVWLLLEKFWLNRIWDRFKDKAVLRGVRHIGVFIITLVGFVIFDFADIKEGLSVISGMFFGGKIPLYSAESIYYVKSYALIIIASMIGATPIFKHIPGKVLKLFEPLGLLILLMLCTALLVDGSFNPFLYFRF